MKIAFAKTAVTNMIINTKTAVTNMIINTKTAVTNMSFICNFMNNSYNYLL